MALGYTARAPGVDRLLIVTESRAPYVGPPGKLIRLERRPSFWDLFDLVRGHPGPFAVLNADCALFDARVIDTLRGDQALWVTRWQLRKRPRPNELYWFDTSGGDYGADLFAFASVPERLPRDGCMPGEAYCDRVIGTTATEAGYQLRNLPCAVPIVHFHR
jgi:hypothetical protein